MVANAEERLELGFKRVGRVGVVPKLELTTVSFSDGKHHWAKPLPSWLRDTMVTDPEEKKMLSLLPDEDLEPVFWPGLITPDAVIVAGSKGAWVLSRSDGKSLLEVHNSGREDRVYLRAGTWTLVTPEATCSQRGNGHGLMTCGGKVFVACGEDVTVVSTSSWASPERLKLVVTGNEAKGTAAGGVEVVFLRER